MTLTLAQSTCPTRVFALNKINQHNIFLNRSSFLLSFRLICAMRGFCPPLITIFMGERNLKFLHLIWKIKILPSKENQFNFFHFCKRKCIAPYYTKNCNWTHFLTVPKISISNALKVFNFFQWLKIKIIKYYQTIYLLIVTKGVRPTIGLKV